VNPGSDQISQPGWRIRQSSHLHLTPVVKRFKLLGASRHDDADYRNDVAQWQAP
jgi:hypothetical protein